MKHFGLKISTFDLTSIPEGIYCYDYRNGRYYGCPFWYREEDGRCACGLLEISDGDSVFDLLWDKVKECGINNEIKEEDLAP